MINKSKIVSLLIKNKLHELGMTQMELSRRMGFCKNSQYVSNITRGRCQVSVKYIPIISEALKIDVDTLVSAMERDFRLAIEEELSKVESNQNSLTPCN
jgi:transcriptional regulator with XRE-family HTH domain